MARSHFPLLAAVLLMLSLVLGASPATSQKQGFYSVNCGGNAYADPSTQIVWKEDPLLNINNLDEYGRATTISPSLKNITNVLKSLRYFPSDSKKNRKFCYSLPASSETTYLLRVSFLYGNYDGLNKPPKFLVILNYDEWTNVTTFASTTPVIHELTFVNNDPILNVCVASHLDSNDNPFISTIEIRPLNKTMYMTSSSKAGNPALVGGYGLMLWRRIDYGARSKTAIRYPDDPYDRIWEADTTGPTVSLNASIVLGLNYTNDLQEPPAQVLATAITSKSPQGNLSFTYDGYGGTGGFRIEMHFEGTLGYGLTFPNSSAAASSAVIPLNTPAPLSVSVDLQLQLPSALQLTLFPAPASPLLNAIELFRWTPQPLFEIRTFQDDVEAINKIQKYFKLSGYGQGDPCMPKGYGWTWISCNIDIHPRIIDINLQSFNLTGRIPPFINNLTNLQKIDLSNNNLSGEIPSLDQLLNLRYLDLHKNNLTGELPTSLIFLPKLATLDVSNNSLCGNPPSLPTFINFTHIGNKRLCDDIKCQCSLITTNMQKRNSKTRKYIVSIVILGALYLMSMLTLLIICKARQHHKTKQEKTIPTLSRDKKGVGDPKVLPSITKMFTYKEMCDATINFTTLLGEGGFGKVYHGLLPSGEAIAVKMLADVSKQGLKEFQNEVAILSRVRHKNLVSLIGFCVENTYMLIYEYIAKGNLRDLIYGDVESTDKPLSWKTRLEIALDASQGLEYLHTGCDPTIIHRDVKSNNVLLTEKMQAKVSDFGLSRFKEGDATTVSHVSTINIVGTAGYLDPAYNTTNQLTDKSDVYSFGIVLFELICGRAPINTSNNPSHIVDWASQSIKHGNIGEIVDPMLANGYKMESMWKVVDLALGCVESDRMKRPKMSKVCELLQSALEIEMDPNYSKDTSGSSSTSDAKPPIFQHIKNLQV